jgi:hypothetical protein
MIGIRSTEYDSSKEGERPNREENLNTKKIKAAQWDCVALIICMALIMLCVFGETQKWSGRRDSNSRPSGWQPDALPTELLPRLLKIIRFGKYRQAFFTSPFVSKRMEWIV